MKTSMLSVVALVVGGWITSFGQATEAEVPGDHFSLEGALELFKKSSSPEEFEKMLNSPDSKVNNLDLNGDGYIDYIRVHDRYEGDVHAFIIQAVISENELQDVAVIELEKRGNGKAVLQIIGDEDVYGVTTIIEPTQEVRTYGGTQTTRTVVNVWAWPSVQYVYGPHYTVWVSPWGWYHRPVWWRTWRPVAYIHYYPVWRPYYHYYAVCHTRRIAYAHHIYHPYRRTSVVVRDRHRDDLTRYRTAYRNDSRNGRTRDDGRRSYASDDRSTSIRDSRSSLRDDRSSTNSADTYLRRRTEADQRTSPQPESNTRGSGSISRERSAPVRSDIRQRQSEETLLRRTVTPAEARQSRQPVQTNPPVMNRSRTPQNQPVQRTTTREHSTPLVNQRSSPPMTRDNYATRRSESAGNDRAVRQEVIRSSGAGSRSSGSISTPQRSSDRSERARPAGRVRQ